MNTKAALSILSRIEELTDSAKSPAEAQGKTEFWQRDKAFIQDARKCLFSNELERVQWLLEQMRNLSQGFGSYCSDLKKIDRLLDELFCELERVVTTR